MIFNNEFIVSYIPIVHTLHCPNLQIKVLHVEEVTSLQEEETKLRTNCCEYEEHIAEKNDVIKRKVLLYKQLIYHKTKSFYQGVIFCYNKKGFVIKKERIFIQNKGL